MNSVDWKKAFRARITARRPDHQAPRRKFNFSATGSLWFFVGSGAFGLIFLVVCLTTFPKTMEKGRVTRISPGDPFLCQTNVTGDFYCPTATVTWNLSNNKSCSEVFTGDPNETTQKFLFRMHPFFWVGRTDLWFVALVGIECRDLSSTVLSIVIGSVIGIVSLLFAVGGVLRGFANAGEERYVEI